MRKKVIFSLEKEKQEIGGEICFRLGETPEGNVSTKQAENLLEIAGLEQIPYCDGAG